MGSRRQGLARTQAMIESLKREISMGGTQLAGGKNKITTVSHLSGNRTLTVGESGTTILWLKGTAHTVTLPSAEVGLNYKIVIRAGSNNEHKIKTSANTQFFFGQVFVAGGDDATATQTVTYGTGNTTPDNYDHLKFDGNATDTGSGAGSVIELEAINSVAWRVTARLVTSGVPTAIATIYAG